MTVIVTHSGRFHADEVLALAILMSVFPGATIIRTRDSEKFEGADFVVDVGYRFDGQKYFDHHQEVVLALGQMVCLSHLLV